MSKMLEKGVILLRKKATGFEEKFYRLTLQFSTQKQQLQESEQARQKAEQGQLLAQEKIRQFEEKIALAEAKTEQARLEYERILHIYLQAQRERFGRKTERFVDAQNPQLPLFPDTLPEAQIGEEPATETDPEDIEDITYKRPRNKGKKNKDSDIPTREEVVSVPENQRVCTCCGKPKDVIGYESCSKLHYKPAEYEIVITKREKMACRFGCEKQQVTAPLLPRILPRCRVTESLLAYICISKVLDRQPLYHLEQSIEQRHHWHISRDNMARWMIQLSEKLQPLINLMKDEIEGYDVAAIDATTLQVLNEPGRSPETKSYAYCIRGGPPGKSVILYEYNAYKQSEYVETEALPGFKGVIHCDAGTVFNRIGKGDGVTLSYCHAHARRKFEQIEKVAAKGKAPLATQAMRIYQRLFAIERQATEHALNPEQIYALRQEKSKPILDEFYTWLIQAQAKTLPKSPIGKAVAYTLSHWQGLLVYLTDGRLKIDNNDTERDIKPFVMARKNFLFACTQKGADSLGVHFSLILTARRHGLNPMAYYGDVFNRIPLCKTLDDYAALLPWNWTSL